MYMNLELPESFSGPINLVQTHIPFSLVSHLLSGGGLESYGLVDWTVTQRVWVLMLTMAVMLFGKGPVNIVQLYETTI